MTSKTRREFTEEFKREAGLLLESSGRPLMQVAKEFGIQPSMLRNWRTRGHGPAGSAAAQAETGKIILPASPEQAEIRRLQKELERAQMERDILKKAMVGSTGQRNGLIS
jgi:transposase